MMVAIGLLAVASVASADESIPEEAAPVDTLIYGYDADTHVFIVHTLSTDATYGCEVPVDVLVGYGSVAEGSFSITPLDDEGIAVEIPELSTDEGSEEAADGICELSGSVVGGPNGQINHGQFMKLFRQILGTKTSGCLNRIIAQSDLGKGDDQVRTSDLEDALETDDSEVDEASDSGTLMLKAFTDVCDPGKKEKGDDHPSKTKGNKDKAKKDESDRQRGNSDNAPGRNN